MRNETADRPWTPGPWGACETGAWSEATGEQVVTGESYTPYGIHSPADAQLIALAPEMAEAILAWTADETWRSVADAECTALYRVADRLRAIGAEAAS